LLTPCPGPDPTNLDRSLPCSFGTFVGEPCGLLVAPLATVPRVSFVKPNGLLVNLGGIATHRLMVMPAFG